MKSQLAFQILLSFVMSSALFLLQPSMSWACSNKSSGHRKTASVSGRKKVAQKYFHKKSGSQSKKSHLVAQNGRPKFIPPTRVRVIDTGSKSNSNSDGFPMPEMKEMNSSAVSKTSSTDTLDVPPPEIQDQFDGLETN